MSQFTINEICKATKAQILVRKEEGFSGLSTDTRQLKKGQIFLALTGENFDGHAFLEQAVALGATALIVSKPPVKPLPVTTFLCSNTLKALQDLAHFHRQRFQLPVIAVTGSNGKTSTKDMLAAVLGQKFSVHKTQGNFNNEIGLPLTLLGLNKEHEVLVVEMGMRGLGQIKDLCEIANPTIGVVTMVGETHLELLGSLENIAQAKAELVESLPESGVAILNEDDERVKAMKSLTKAKTVSFGFSRAAQVQALSVQRDGFGLSVTFKLDDKLHQAFLPVLGDHQIRNALAAFAVAAELGLKAQEMIDGLANFVPSGMRQAVTTTSHFTVMNDAYNASPVSVRAALKTLKDLAQGRSVAVLGDMLELGTVAEESHRNMGLEAAKLSIDLVITVGELSSLAYESIKDLEQVESYHCKNHDEAKRLLSKVLQSGDTILVKGSRGMKMEVLAQYIVELDGLI